MTALSPGNHVLQSATNTIHICADRVNEASSKANHPRRHPLLSPPPDKAIANVE
jgi:hypothetical protein